MSGHSKWSQIKRQKGKSDVRKGLTFTKLSNALTLAVKQTVVKFSTSYKLSMTLKTQAIQTALSGNWEKAIDINKSLIKEDPSDIDALNRLAFAFTILGKTKDAKSTTKITSIC